MVMGISGHDTSCITTDVPLTIRQICGLASTDVTKVERYIPITGLDGSNMDAPITQLAHFEFIVIKHLWFR